MALLFCFEFCSVNCWALCSLEATC